MLMHTVGSKEKLTFDTSPRLKQEIIQIQARSISRMSYAHLACSRNTHIPNKLIYTHTHHEIYKYIYYKNKIDIEITE